MCLKNVNFTVIPCLESASNGTSLIGMFDGIKASQDESGNFYLSKLCLFVNISIVLPKDGSAPHDNEIETGSIFDVSIRITHIASSTFVDIDDFPLHLEEDKIIRACREFWEFHRLITTNNLQLNGLGKYAIKVRIKKKGSNTWTTQAIHCFEVS